MQLCRGMAHSHLQVRPPSHQLLLLAISRDPRSSQTFSCSRLSLLLGRQEPQQQLPLLQTMVKPGQCTLQQLCKLALQ